MNGIEPPPSKPSDELDALLRAFFRSQMPQPWPAPRPSPFRTAPTPRSPATRRGLSRSRWALAASIGLLLLGSFALPSRLAPDGKNDAVPGGPMTSGNELRRKMQQEHKQRHLQPKHHPGLGEVGGQVPELEDF